MRCYLLKMDMHYLCSGQMFLILKKIIVTFRYNSGMVLAIFSFKSSDMKSSWLKDCICVFRFCNWQFHHKLQFEGNYYWVLSPSFFYNPEDRNEFAMFCQLCTCQKFLNWLQFWVVHFCCPLPAARRLPLAAHRPPPSTCHLQPTAHGTHRLLNTTHHLQPTVHWLLPFHCKSKSFIKLQPKMKRAIERAACK